MTDSTQAPEQPMAQTPTLQQMQLAYQATVRFNTTNELAALAHEMTSFFTEAGGQPAIVLRIDPETERLIRIVEPDGTLTPDGAVASITLPNLPEWLDGQIRLLKAADYEDRSALETVLRLHGGQMILIPLTVPRTAQLVGAVLIQTADLAKVEPLNAAANVAAIALRNAVSHIRITGELDTKSRELELMLRVDRELNDTMKQSLVLEITLDWAMRITTANGASLALYDENTDELHQAIDLGYQLPPARIALLRSSMGGGIAYRVARSGHIENVPDVAIDSDYVEISPTVKSHLSVPVLREDRVIAVMSLESRHLNHFTDERIDFAEKLATRAGVAIDNARLYASAVREREKYSLILGATSDVVITVGADDRIVQMNPAAVAALRLYADREYIGASFLKTIEDSPLEPVFRRIKSIGQPSIEEIPMPDGRTYHASFTTHDQIGWIIVMHDISEFKKMDQLKNELVATVSHDLRQPLMVMMGYVELLTLHNTVDERGQRYIGMLARSIGRMRRLIEDLLDLAKIESGMQLHIEPTSIASVIDECMETARSAADSKQIVVEIEVPDNLPKVAGDPARLGQIFNNLIMNAIKYTPPEGKIRVSAETRDNRIRVAVQDTGVGISPQDQARIFDRFYRVRNAENESIEGTGLGLAIVKRLIDAHHGQIGLESRIGHGSTFHVTLPTSTAEDSA